jgi:hypothetical protein
MSSSAAFSRPTVLWIDSMEEELGDARLLFVDAEGSEVGVLRGAEAFLSRHKPVIFIEVEATLRALEDRVPPWRSSGTRSSSTETRSPRWRDCG